MANIAISISAEPIFYIGNFAVTNSMISTIGVTLFLCGFAIWFNRKLQRINFDDKPGRLQALVEFILESLFNMMKDTAGEFAKARVYFPFIATFFLYIIFSNWSGLLPGVGTIGIREYHHESESNSAHAESNSTHEEAPVHEPAVEPATLEEISLHEEPAAPEHGEAIKAQEEITVPEPAAEAPIEEEGVFVPIFRAPTADLNTTLALALYSITMVQLIGIKYVGLAYFTKFINLKSPILFVVGILEIFSEISRIISFAFRLFGNIFAGEVLLVVISSIVPVLAPLPFLGLELFVGFIQALVFAMLSLVFVNMATIAHDEH